jgi:hypothetical protein
MKSSVIERTKPVTDQQRETAIQSELALCAKAREASDLPAAGAHWRKAVELIQERSPEQVARMEKEKNLL